VLQVWIARVRVEEKKRALGEFLFFVNM